MKYITQKLFLFTLLFFCAGAVLAQPGWPSPEVEQMYLNARRYTDAGNYTDAITTFKQAIALAPKVMILYRDLGEALYRSGKYKEAEQVLAPLADDPNADAKCYQLLAASLAARHDTKHALAILKKGIGYFASSGSLYHEQGKIFAAQNEQKKALSSWLDGIEKDPSFALNYYDAAVVYLSSKKVGWGLLYGEMFLSMTHDTLHDAELKKNLFVGYKKMFDDMVRDNLPEYGSSLKQATVNTFDDAVKNIYITLTPVVSDGVTTETLTMLHVRFLMEWFSLYAKKYPFSYFSYQQNLIKNGRFDVYHEWLFGNAESAAEYKAWNEFHEGDMERFLKWRSANLFVPASGEFYNDRNMDGVFGKKKR